MDVRSAASRMEAPLCQERGFSRQFIATSKRQAAFGCNTPPPTSVAPTSAQERKDSTTTLSRTIGIIGLVRKSRMGHRCVVISAVSFYRGSGLSKQNSKSKRSDNVLGRSTCKRGEKRFPPVPGAGAAALYYDDVRFPAKVLDESESGLALRVLSDTPFKIGRKVMVILLQRDTRSGIIIRVNPHSDGATIGIRLER